MRINHINVQYIPIFRNIFFSDNENLKWIGWRIKNTTSVQVLNKKKFDTN